MKVFVRLTLLGVALFLTGTSVFFLYHAGLVGITNFAASITFLNYCKDFGLASIPVYLALFADLLYGENLGRPLPKFKGKPSYIG